MPPTIHVIRHAEAAHNVAKDATLRDPKLTETGLSQCEKLASEVAKLGPIEVVLCSPMKRTIQTALAGFPDYVRSKKRIVLLPDLQESGKEPCDIGSTREELEREFGRARLDYSFVAPGWTDKTPSSRYAPQCVLKRARATRLFLRTVAQRHRDTDAHIAVVTHGTYIGALTRTYGQLFGNTEMRSFRFDPLVGGDDIDALLVETPSSIARRDGNTSFLSKIPIPQKKTLRFFKKS
ncbi:putative phosphoglycerate mutase family protein [Rosellinia necatrix]|uniref:Putative phosphoglycerate mutase family protein n=1 Tax=Rosellinia necatrix TaxID=77044 RepID=A0A1S7UME8_ROSNE|nr:putative phosphoglycerate mutase family protein [Rosellinia necatrix]